MTTTHLILELSPLTKTNYEHITFYKRSVSLYFVENKRKGANIFFINLSSVSLHDLILDIYKTLNKISEYVEDDAQVFFKNNIALDDSLIQFVYDKESNNFYETNYYFFWEKKDDYIPAF